jgi:signal transduction histidine kinase
LTRFEEVIDVSSQSSRSADYDRLSANARKMLELRDAVLDEWDKRLRQAVKEAERLPHPILIDTFPSLYENLAEAMSPGYPRTSAEEGATIASEHGGERARLTNYNARAVITEYQVLRLTILDVLKQHGVQLDNGEIFIINTSLDDAIRESVSSFALAQAALRERFVAALTHDLRNPLSTANVAAELIKRISEPDKIKELADRITDNLARMDAMIRDLLDSVIFQSGERLRLRLEECDAMEIASEVCEQFNEVYGPRFQLTGDATKGWWDRETLKRAIENLVGNALKYGVPGTPIRIDIDTLHGRMMLAVHNDGEPIPPDQIECIFQVFQRARAAKEGDKPGWGIGLPYVRSVAESHGGSVSVDSAMERGTTFMMDLPLDARPFQETPVLGKGTDRTA